MKSISRSFAADRAAARAAANPHKKEDLIHEKDFSEYQACIDFGINTNTLEKWIAYLIDHKYIVYKDGKMKAGKRTSDKMFSSRLLKWKKVFESDTSEQRIVSTKSANTYIPKDFSSSFNGYKN